MNRQDEIPAGSTASKLELSSVDEAVSDPTATLPGAVRDRDQRRNKRRRGMTLIEIMVVVVIIGLIGSVVTVAVVRQLERAKVETARQQICNLEQALNLYKIQKGNFPTNAEGLQSLVGAGIWGKPKIPRDPWKAEYVYRFPSSTNPDGFDLLSYAADGREGGSSYNTKDIRCQK